MTGPRQLHGRILILRAIVCPEGRTGDEMKRWAAAGHARVLLAAPSDLDNPLPDQDHGRRSAPVPSCPGRRPVGRGYPHLSVSPPGLSASRPAVVSGSAVHRGITHRQYQRCELEPATTTTSGEWRSRSCIPRRAMAERYGVSRMLALAMSPPGPPARQAQSTPQPLMIAASAPRRDWSAAGLRKTPE